MKKKKITTNLKIQDEAHLEAIKDLDKEFPNALILPDYVPAGSIGIMPIVTPPLSAVPCNSQGVSNISYSYSISNIQVSNGFYRSS